MTTTITPDTARARVARIVAAYTAAETALVELSDAIHDAVKVPEHDDAIAAGYALAYSATVDAEGLPTGQLVHEHGDRLLLRAADIRQQLVELIETCYEVPSDYEPDPDAARRLDALRRDPQSPIDGPGTCDHYHVFAVQDWGGSQEWWTGVGDELTAHQAHQRVEDMVDADSLVYGVNPDHDQACREYGDRLDALVSSNVCPGWDAMWVRGCPAGCRYHALLRQVRADAHRAGSEQTAPYWTPSHGGEVSSDSPDAA